MSPQKNRNSFDCLPPLPVVRAFVMKMLKRKSGRAAARRAYVAVRPIGVATKKDERRRLMKVLNNRALKDDDQARLKAEFAKIQDPDAQLQFLRENVHVAPTPGRPPKPMHEGFQVSVGKQVRGTSAKTLHMDVFCKVFRTNSLAAQRTQALYGFLRFMGLEESTPVAKLLAVVVDGQQSEFQFAHCGGDLRHKRWLSDEQYLKARQASIDELVAVGVDPRAISHHKANWALTKDGSKPYRCILIDVGRAVLAKDAVAQMRQRWGSIRRFTS